MRIFRARLRSDVRSEGSDVTDVNGDDHFTDITSSIRPYAFEPMIDAADIIGRNIAINEEIERTGDEGNINNIGYNWCRCNKCHTENVDRVCCRHLDIHHVDRETECVTNSEEFKEICLYRPYLEVILVGLSRIRGDHLENNTSNRSFWFAAYTAITW